MNENAKVMPDWRKVVQAVSAARATLSITQPRFDELWADLLRAVKVAEMPDSTKLPLTDLMNTISMVRDAHENANVAILKVSALTLEFIEPLMASKRGRQDAKRRLAKDPKQRDKLEIEELWRQWQAGPIALKPGEVRPVSNAAFARFAQLRFPAILDPDTIRGWLTTWGREKSRGLAG